MKRSDEILWIAFSGFVVAALLSGCATPSSVKHYLKNANADVAAVPKLITVNPENDQSASILSFKSGYSNKDHVRLTAEDGQDSLHPVVGSPGNYTVNWSVLGLGAGFQFVASKNFDLFLSFNTDVDHPFKNNAALFGFGINFPFPWVDFRIAPALGLHNYRASYTDSIVEHYVSDPSMDTSYLQSSSNRGSSFLGSIGFTAWPSDQVIGKTIKPYVGFQYSGMTISTGEDFFGGLDWWQLPPGVLDLTETEWVVGLHYNFGGRYFLNVAGSRQELYNSNSSAVYYRVESSIEVNAD